VILICGMMVNSVIAYFINSYWSGKFINYSIKEQLKDILPALVIALFMGVSVFLIGEILPVSYLLKLIIQIITGIAISISICEIFRLEAFFEIKQIAKERILAFRSRSSLH